MWKDLVCINGEKSEGEGGRETETVTETYLSSTEILATKPTRVTLTNLCGPFNHKRREMAVPR